MLVVILHYSTRITRSSPACQLKREMIDSSDVLTRRPNYVAYHISPRTCPTQIGATIFFAL